MGIVVKGACQEFIDTLEAHRESHPPEKVALEREAVSPEAERAARRFAIKALIGAILLGVAIAALVVVLSSKKADPNPEPPVRPPGEHDLRLQDDDRPRLPQRFQREDF